MKKLFPFFNEYPELLYFDTAATSLKSSFTINSLKKMYDKYSVAIEKSVGLPPVFFDDCIQKTTALIQSILRGERYKIFYAYTATLILSDLVKIFSALAKSQNNKLIVLIPQTVHISFFNPLLEYSNFFIIKEYANNADILDYQLTQKIDLLYIPIVDHITGNFVDKSFLLELKKKNSEIRIIADATQSMRLHKEDLSDGVYDIFLFSSHKMYGSEGLAVVALHEEFLATILVKLSYSWYDIQKMFAHGSLPYAAIGSFYDTLIFLDNYIYNNYLLKNNMHLLSNHIFNYLKKNADIYMVSSKDNFDIITFKINSKILQRINDLCLKKSCIIRTGLLCGKSINGYDSLARISLGCYITYEDVKKLIEVISLW